MQPMTEELDLAVGVNYIQYEFSDQIIGGIRSAVSRNLEPITVNGIKARERFFGLRLHGLYSSLDDRNLPTAGTKIRFGMEQSVPLGQASTFF